MRHSKLESDIFKFKIGREELTTDDFSQVQFEKEIYSGGFDVCRIKLYGGKKDLLESLKKLSYPYEIYTINYFNSLLIKDKPKIERDPLFSIREVSDAKSDIEFQEILEDVLDNNDWVEYTSILSGNVMPLSLRKLLAKDYYSRFTKDYNEHAFTGVLNKENKGIGLFMGEFKENTFHGSIFGLKKEYRSKGYAKYFYDFMCEICQYRGIDYFVDEVNIFNIPSQKSASSQKLVPERIYINVSVFPFYDFLSKISCSIEVKEFTFSSIVMYLEKHFADFKIKEIHAKSVEKMTDSKVNRLIKLCPVFDSSDIYFVFHFLHNDTIKHSYYIHLIKAE
ncbi:MAG: hypothetical protein EA412_14505 [Chitinophagaceae bacterium]|nr:MAG: hypothetical protein EA412_14505 [Chitinophagaceae bacterium]